MEKVDAAPAGEGRAERSGLLIEAPPITSSQTPLTALASAGIVITALASPIRSAAVFRRAASGGSGSLRGQVRIRSVNSNRLKQPTGHRLLQARQPPQSQTCARPPPV